MRLQDLKYLLQIKDTIVNYQSAHIFFTIA